MSAKNPRIKGLEFVKGKDHVSLARGNDTGELDFDFRGRVSN
jgi:hypothetical protein